LEYLLRFKNANTGLKVDLDHNKKEREGLGMKSIKSTRYMTIGMRLVLFLLLTAGQSFAQKVSVDFDKAIDFSKYKTYAFTEGTPTPVTLTNQRIEKAIEAQLAAKGLTRLESDADLTVVFHCSVIERTQFSTRNLDGWGWGPGWGWGRGWRRWGGAGTEITEVEQIPVGTLIVDIGDSSTKRYIWRGTATKTISSKPDKNEKAIDEAMKKMFEKFPPQRKG
jgi:hypothetical protein